MKMLRIYLSIDDKLSMFYKVYENFIVTTPVQDISEIHTSKSIWISSLFTTFDSVVKFESYVLFITRVSFKVSLISLFITKILKL